MRDVRTRGGRGSRAWPRPSTARSGCSAWPRRVLVAARRRLRGRAGPDPVALRDRAGPPPPVPVRGRNRAYERMTTRGSLVDAPAPERPLTGLLRPVHRADADVAVRADGTVAVTRGVPLRAWYPFEVFRFPPEQAAAGRRRRLRTPSSRTRAFATLCALRDPAVEGPSRCTPAGGERSQLAFPVPDLVDEAAYAVECAAVGEVDLAGSEVRSPSSSNAWRGSRSGSGRFYASGPVSCAARNAEDEQTGR